MNRINRVFENLKNNHKKALIAYITAGFPSLEYTDKIVHVLNSSGADIIELGVPFSDPIADGPTIQRASEEALKRGVNLRSILKLVRKIRKSIALPIVLMGYYNPFLSYGIERFTDDSAESGVDGLIIPDLPPEEGGELIRHARRKNLATVFLLAPTSTDERIKLVSNFSTGFIYYVSLTGVTGSRDNLPEGIEKKIQNIRKFTDLPVCVGFGVSKPDQAKMLSKFADGVIVGSAIIKIILEGKNQKETVKKISNFIIGLKGAIS
jgi:tryptophan synthase alpha chain